MTGPAQQWNAAGYHEFASFVPALAGPLLDMLDAKPGEHILDLGCGDGVLTRKIAVTGARVTAVDADADMIEAAKASGLDAKRMDGTSLSFDEAFDAVFSNAALHWMTPPENVVKGVHRALKDGGRFIAEMGGSGNVKTARAALHDGLTARGIDPAGFDPWYFPAPEAYAMLLERQGFDIFMLRHFARPTPLTGDVRHWLTIFGGSFLKALPEPEHDAYLEEVARRLRKSLPKDEDGHYLLDYVRLRFKAVKR